MYFFTRNNKSIYYKLSIIFIIKFINNKNIKMKRDIQRSNRNRGRMPARRGGRRPQRHNEDRGERRGNRFNRGRRSNNNQPRRRFRNAERPQRFRGGKGRRLGKKKTPTAEQLDNDLDNYYKKAGKGENCKI